MKNPTKHYRKLLLIASTIASIIYIGWRLFYTIPMEFGLLSMIAGISLFTAEVIGAVEMFIHYRLMSDTSTPEKPSISSEEYPEVDVLIATHSESPELLYKTINGCIHMKYPDTGKVHIYVCDDNNRAEMQQLAAELQVGYIGLAGNKHAKAGNINNALKQTNSPLVVTFDADMIPTHNFLMETVPYFFLPFKKKDGDGNWINKDDEEYDPNYKIGFIQTPQSFYNTDLFQYNLYAERNIPNEQDYFFKEINVGRNQSNSPIYAGSNTVISRAALDEVNGIAIGTITEDFATGIEIQAKGYTCYALPDPLAHGLAPNDFKSLIKQRQRWGRGCVQVIRSRKFLFNHLTLRSKLSYISSFLYWWTFMRRFIYIISPILFTVFGIIVVKASMIELLLVWLPYYLLYNKSLTVLSGNIRNQKWSNIVDTILFPYMIIPVLLETIGLKLHRFIVTPKDNFVKKSEMKYAIPNILLALITIVGIWRCVRDMIVYQSFANIVLLFWLIANLYFLYMSIVFMVNRPNYRKEDRYYASVKTVVTTDTSKYSGVTYDISERGLSILLKSPIFIPYDENIKIEIEYLDYRAEVYGRVVHVSSFQEKWKYSIKITDMDQLNKQSYYQIIFDRDHSLPNSISSNTVEDIKQTIVGNTRNNTLSNRRLPRIPVHATVNTVDLKPVTIIDFNYEFIHLANVKTDEIIQLDFDDGLILTCIPKHINKNSKGVYAIENWKVISRDKRLRNKLQKLLNITLDGDEMNYVTS